MTKEELRKIYLEKRKALSHKQTMVETDLLLIQFQNLHLPSFENVLSYRAIASKQEIDMDIFESYLELTNPSTTFCYPVCDLQTCTLQAISTDSETAFSVNKWGIEEPQSNTILSPKDIDIVFVPFLAFDEKGFRVGYGKGFYDRFLSLCRPDVLKVGFSFFPPEKNISDVNDFDIPLHIGITPEKIYVFS